jgi:hypothetical protein
MASSSFTSWFAWFSAFKDGSKERVQSRYSGFTRRERFVCSTLGRIRLYLGWDLFDV